MLLHGRTKHKETTARVRTNWGLTNGYVGVIKGLHKAYIGIM